MLFTDFAEMFASMARGGSYGSGPGSFASAFGGGATGAVRGEDIQMELGLDLMEAVKGCEKVGTWRIISHSTSAFDCIVHLRCCPKD